MTEEIKAWLQGPRKYMDGVALYEKYGTNKLLKNNFARGNNEMLYNTLVYELCKLAGVTEQEANAMPRLAETPVVVTVQVVPNEKQKPPAHIDDLLLQLAGSFGVSVDNLFSTEDPKFPATEAQQKAIELFVSEYKEVPETMKKVIRIREQYPFLREETCPVELKLLVHDMFTAYDVYREAYAQLDDKNSQDENLQLAATVVENYLSNRAMWEELDYYKENATILGKHEMFDLMKMREEIAQLSDLDLAKKINSSKPNITKAKNALEAATTDEKKTECLARLDKWNTYVAELEAELDRRKK